MASATRTNPGESGYDKMIFDKVGAEGKNLNRNAPGGIIEKRYGDSPISISNKATIGSGNSV